MRSFDEMNRMFSEMDRTFDQMRSAWWNQAGMETGRPALGTDRPALETDRRPIEPGLSATERSPWFGGFDGEAAVDFADEGDEFVFVMDLPGFEREDIDLAFDDGLLSIRAVREVEDGSEGLRSMRSRRIGKQVGVPREVVTEEITASYRNGVLEVRLPTVEDEQEETGHRIDID